MVVDITSRKEAERSLKTLSGRLIEAQEQERRRIARDLHDDINQRAGDSEYRIPAISRRPAARPAALRKRIEELGARASKSPLKFLHSPRNCTLPNWNC